MDAVTDDDAACVVLDIKMPGIDGLEVQRRLAEQEKTIPVIIVTAYGDVAMAVRAMRAGAIDFIEKPVARDRLIASVERAIEAGTNLRRHLNERSEIERRIDTLTPREREVFEQLVMGRPNKIAAYELGISPRTVEIYRKNVMVKMVSEGKKKAENAIIGLRRNRFEAAPAACRTWFGWQSSPVSTRSPSKPAHPHVTTWARFRGLLCGSVPSPPSPVRL